MPEQTNGTDGGTSVGLVGADGEPLRYEEAVAELNGILNQLESADVDVDHLARQVERAAQLVGYCRARLDVIKDDVDAVIETLQDGTT